MDQTTIKYYAENAAQVAERYESVVSDLSAHFADSFSKGGKILDIGCGSGRDLAVLHKLGFDCYVYANMPAFGLGKAGTLVEAKGGLRSATDRFTSK